MKLRAITIHDAEDIYLTCIDADMQRFTTIPANYTREMATQFASEVTDSRWAITTPEFGDRYCGNIELRTIDATTADIGYSTSPWARGRGLQTAALQQVVEIARERGFQNLYLWADVDNAASRRVAEKAGFSFEGLDSERQCREGVNTAKYSLDLSAPPSRGH